MAEQSVYVSSCSSSWPKADLALTLAGCRLLADCVEKVFLGDERNFLELLTRFERGDVMDHIDSSKIDHGPS